MSSVSIISALYQVHMFIENELFTDITTILGLLASVAIIISAAFAIFQWKKTKRFNGVKHIQQLRADLYNDNEIIETFYMFERNEQWYTPDFHKTNEVQRKVDKTLSVLEHACFLRMNKYIDKNQFTIIQYQVEKTLSNIQVQAYLHSFKHGLPMYGLPMLFPCLIKYGSRKGLLPEDFMNINSSIYSQYR